MMRRRVLFASMAATALSPGRALTQQPARVPRIGALFLGNPEPAWQMIQNDLPSAQDSSEWVVRTLLFVDVVESVRLMEENENDVVRRWRKFVGVVEKEILPLHDGRLIKSHGDGLLLEFPVVPPAVKTALAG